MKYSVRPLSDRSWLRPPSKRQTTRFSASWKETEQLLVEEVDRLNGRALVIEVDVREQDLRLDGTLRANAREAATPAVVVAFETTKHGPMLYRCDTFTAPYRSQGPDWQHNVRAVALTLQALRAVDRYGATDTGQQYTGFKALPSGHAMPAPTMAKDDAVRLLHRVSQLGADSSQTIPQNWSLEAHHKKARARAHPDRHDGDQTLWDQVEQAARTLGLLR